MTICKLGSATYIYIIYNIPCTFSVRLSLQGTIFSLIRVDLPSRDNLWEWWGWPCRSGICRVQLWIKNNFEMVRGFSRLALWLCVWSDGGVTKDIDSLGFLWEDAHVWMFPQWIVNQSISIHGDNNMVILWSKCVRLCVCARMSLTCAIPCDTPSTGSAVLRWMMWRVVSPKLFGDSKGLQKREKPTFLAFAEFEPWCASSL